MATKIKILRAGHEDWIERTGQALLDQGYRLHGELHCIDRPEGDMESVEPFIEFVQMFVKDKREITNDASSK